MRWGRGPWRVGNTVQRHGIYERDLSGSFLLGTTYNHNFLRPRRGEWGYLTTPRLYHVGDVAAVVFAIQRWPRAQCTGFAVYQINNTGGRIGCYFTDHPFGDLTCYNLYDNLFLNESQAERSMSPKNQSRRNSRRNSNTDSESEE